MQAVEILRRSQLGRPVEAYVWTGKVERGTYFVEPWSEYTPATPVPESLNWDLWRGPLAAELPYSEDLAPRRWRRNRRNQRDWFDSRRSHRPR